MRKNRKMQVGWKIVQGLSVLLLAMLIGLGSNQFAIVSHAESEGKVTANSAKIRQEPSTSSKSLASALKDAKVSINGQVAAADGYTWYQVFVDGTTLGYIRSDLVEITDGSTPPTVTPTTGSTTPAEPTGGDEELVGVTAVNPISATVTGGQAVRVRQNASTTSKIVTTVQDGLEITVVGSAVGTDGKDWYQVSYIANGMDVSGFIRSEYLQLSGELQPADTGYTEDPGQTEDPVDWGEQPVDDNSSNYDSNKAWDTYQENDVWHLVDNVTGDSYDIESIFQIAQDNKEVAEDALKSKNSQRIVIIILFILLIGLVVLTGFLFLKLRDATDSAYINEVERETIRRRTSDRPSSGQKKVMHTVGKEDKRPAGQRPSEQRSTVSGQRPVGQGQRVSEGRPSEQRTSVGGQRPVGQGQRVSEGRPSEQRPYGGQQGGSTQGRQSKNFASDDFDDQIIDWDGDDE